MRSVYGIRLRLIGLLAAGGLMNTGCSTMSDTATGTGIGAAIGTGVGLAAGAATGNPKTGAVVGGLLGAGTGAAIGNASDQEKQERREVRQAVASAQAAQARAQLGMIDVVQLAMQGQSEEVIINQIRSTGSTFQLTATDLAYLKQNNVSDRVIVEMQSARGQPVAVAGPQAVYVTQPPAVVYGPGYYYGPPRPVVYVRGRW